MQRVEVPRKRSKGNAPPGGRARDRQRRPGPYGYEFRLRAMRLYVDEGYAPSLVAEQMGCSTHALYDWARAYREHGEGALRPKRRCAP